MCIRDRCAANPRIHTFIATSDIHLKHKLKKTKDEVLEIIGQSVRHSAKYTSNVEFSCEDATRTDLDFLCKAINVAIESGATTINIPDTVGYTVPSEFREIIKNLKSNIELIDNVTISVHCHNDLGLAVANSLAAISEGARQVECTINGLGERAGNASMEEIVMAIKTRNDLLPFKTGIQTKMITKTSKLVSKITGFEVQPNKAIVGANAFAHESGIHQDGMLKHSNTYEIMTPESVGLKETKLVLGKHSGKHAFSVKLQELGYKINKKNINKIFSSFKELADRKKDLYEEDIVALVEDEIIRVNNHIKFVSLDVHCGSTGAQKAELELEVNGFVKKNDDYFMWVGRRSKKGNFPNDLDQIAAGGLPFNLSLIHI